MMPGMPAFWALAGTQTRRLTWGRARAPEAAETAAQKEQPASQPGNAKATEHHKLQRFVAGVARARQKARKPTRKKQGPRSTRASHSKSKTDRTTAHRSAQQVWTVFTAFCRARTQHRRHARQRLAPKCAKMSLAYIPPIPIYKTVVFGLRGFLEGNLDDADQAPLKHHPGPTPDLDDVSSQRTKYFHSNTPGAVAAPC